MGERFVWGAMNTSDSSKNAAFAFPHHGGEGGVGGIFIGTFNYLLGNLGGYCAARIGSYARSQRAYKGYGGKGNNKRLAPWRAEHTHYGQLPSAAERLHKAQHHDGQSRHRDGANQRYAAYP